MKLAINRLEYNGKKVKFKPGTSLTDAAKEIKNKGNLLVDSHDHGIEDFDKEK